MTAPAYLLVDPERRDVGAWNGWRANHPAVHADLCWAQLSGADLRGANLSGADLRAAHLRDADLRDVDLRDADLASADLSGANLCDAVGVRHPDVVAAVPVGSGEMCSARRGPDGEIVIWAGCEGFASFDACRSRIIALGGPDEAERLAWLNWVETRLAKVSS